MHTTKLRKVGGSVMSCHSAKNFVQNSSFHEFPMAFTAGDIVQLSQARASFSEVADQVEAGAKKIVTKNGESYVAVVDAQRLDCYHQLEREHIHLQVIDDASAGLRDVAEGRVRTARTALAALKRSRIVE